MHKLAFTLLVIGGLNWILVGIFGWDIGSIFGGQDAVISRILYILIGLSAVVEMVKHKSNCSSCVKAGNDSHSEMSAHDSEHHGDMGEHNHDHDGGNQMN